MAPALQELFDGLTAWSGRALRPLGQGIRAAPPSRSQAPFLRLGLAYGYQTQGHGDLSAKARRRLERLVQELDRTGTIMLKRDHDLRPGKSRTSS